MKTIELPKVETLTLPELRVKCAEGSGWTLEPIHHGGYVLTSPEGKIYLANDGWDNHHARPNYPEDANAALGLCAGHQVEIVHHHEAGVWSASFIEDEDTHWAATAISLPLAICRAYVLAKGLATN